jgi:hypothetical protein
MNSDDFLLPPPVFTQPLPLRSWIGNRRNFIQFRKVDPMRHTIVPIKNHCRQTGELGNRRLTIEVQQPEIHRVVAPTQAFMDREGTSPIVFGNGQFVACCLLEPKHPLFDPYGIDCNLLLRLRDMQSDDVIYAVAATGTGCISLSCGGFDNDQLSWEKFEHQYGRCEHQYPFHSAVHFGRWVRGGGKFHKQ